MSFPEVTRTASFIYRSKTGSYHEFCFEAENDHDLIEKGSFITETMRGAMAGSIFGWQDDDAIIEYRQSVSK